MNITGAVFDGLHNDQICKFNDRSLLAGSGELVEIDFFDGFLDRLDAVGFGITLLLSSINDVLHRAAALGGINGGKFVGDCLFGRNERRNFELGDALDVVEGEHVQRIRHRKKQFVVQP